MALDAEQRAAARDLIRKNGNLPPIVVLGLLDQIDELEHLLAVQDDR